MMSYKINSLDERAGRRVHYYPSATARIPELSECMNGRRWEELSWPEKGEELYRTPPKPQQ